MSSEYLFIFFCDSLLYGGLQSVMYHADFNIFLTFFKKTCPDISELSCCAEDEAGKLRTRYARHSPETVEYLTGGQTMC